MTADRWLLSIVKSGLLLSMVVDKRLLRQVTGRRLLRQGMVEGTRP
jgi:hypothetical protein